MTMRKRLIWTYLFFTWIPILFFVLFKSFTSIHSGVSLLLILIIMSLFAIFYSSNEKISALFCEIQSGQDWMQSRFFSEMIFQNIREGVFVLDKELHVLEINNAAAKMVGYKPERMIGSLYTEKLRFRCVKTGGVSNLLITKAFATKKNQEIYDEVVLVNKSGKKINVTVKVVPLIDIDNVVLGCVVIFNEITDVREINKAKIEFISLASHQLRTPLSAIGWYVEMLLEGDAGSLNKEQAKYLSEVYKGNQRMVDLVNALLNVSRLELGTYPINPQPIKISDLAKTIINQMQSQIQEKNIHLEEHYDDLIPKVPLDESLMNIIFQNLLSNSVKYTSENGLVDIAISVRKKGEEMDSVIALADSLFITIRDSGYGIPKEQQRHIFEKLFRADNVRVLDTEGTGLGLYMVKTIVEQTGGKIWFTSAEHKGTTFFVQIPISGMKKRNEDLKQFT